MRYASIREMDISNGEGIGISLFVQGCHRHCKNCFNPNTWDFNGGNEWNEEIENKFLKLASRPFVTRVSLLGGEPLEYPHSLYSLLQKIKTTRQDIKIWLYSGYTYEEAVGLEKNQQVLSYVDVMVDGAFVDELKDLTLPFRGSTNQRIIDVQKSLKNGEIILYKKETTT